MWSVSSLLRPEIPEVSQGQGPGAAPWSLETAFPWLSDGPRWVGAGWGVVSSAASSTDGDPYVCVHPCLGDLLRHSRVVTIPVPFVFSTCVSSTVDIEGTRKFVLLQCGGIEGQSGGLILTALHYPSLQCPSPTCLVTLAVHYPVLWGVP